MRLEGHCWRAKQEFASDLLPWAPSHGSRRVGYPETTYIDKECYDTECHINDLPVLMLNRMAGPDRHMNVHASSTE